MSPFKRRLLDTVFQGATLVRVGDRAARPESATFGQWTTRPNTDGPSSLGKTEVAR